MVAEAQSEARRSRSPRFRRRRAPPPISLTARDCEIVRHVARHRFLRSSHIVKLLGARSEQAILRRLQALYHAGFLDRPRAQIDYYRPGGGSEPIVYALGNAGADLLAARFGIPRTKVDWTAKNRTAGREFLQHTLAVAEVMTSFEFACRARGNVRLIEPEEILEYAPERTRRAKRPFGWRVRVPFGEERALVGVVPDKIFGLHFLDKPEGRNKAYFFLEVDRGTMPVVRKNLRQTSFLRKLLGYAYTRPDKVHTAHYGINHFRVLTVTTSPERAQSMIEAFEKHVARLAPPSMFLFTDKAALADADVLSLAWRNGRDDEVRLVAHEKGHSGGIHGLASAM